jgi:hypothetical protein
MTTILKLVETNNQCMSAQTIRALIFATVSNNTAHTSPRYLSPVSATCVRFKKERTTKPRYNTTTGESSLYMFSRSAEQTSCLSRMDLNYTHPLGCPMIPIFRNAKTVLLVFDGIGSQQECLSAITELRKK